MNERNCCGFEQLHNNFKYKYQTNSLKCNAIGRVSLARENEAGGSWGQKVHILHVKV